MTLNFNKVKDKIKNGYPKAMDRSLSYGTAGFRGPSSHLDWVMFRMGLLGVLRSKHQKGRAIGAMITASHNPVGDNGIKLIDPNGEMLEASWESAASELVNADDPEVTTVLRNIITRYNIDFSIPAIVYLAQDTRPSSGVLSIAFRDGVEVLGASVKDFHLLTTPQLHHIVNAQNRSFVSPDELDSASRSCSGGDTQEDPSEEGYYNKLVEGFYGLLRLKSPENLTEDHYENEIYVDGANGIGAIKAAELRQRLTGAEGLKLPVFRIFNDGKDGVLNENCGADFVKVAQKPPKGAPTAAGIKCVSFDGDADRIVYFYFDKEGHFRLLDGDKIAALLSSFFVDAVRESGLDLKIGVVQTAYANGASTNYIQKMLKVPVECVPTGVKYLHHKAKDYDIGIYFEANGHGTVLFSSSAKEQIRKRIDSLQKTNKTGKIEVDGWSDQKQGSNRTLAAREQQKTSSEVDETSDQAQSDFMEKEKQVEAKAEGEVQGESEELPPTPPASPTSKEPPEVDLIDLRETLQANQVEERLEQDRKPEREMKALQKLSSAANVINQTVGDALADMLLVEAVLNISGLSIKTWDEYYRDLPNRQVKVKVSDRNAVQTVDAERKCSAPKELQTAIDKAVYQFPAGRAFARPSGTEDVVRVYAEADSQANADKLAYEVALAVFRLAGGVGAAPLAPS